MSTYVHCDKCKAILPKWREGGSDGLERKLEIRLGNNAVTADLCPDCYAEVFVQLRALFPGNLASVEPPKRLDAK